jgi:hypothetical protein
MVEVEMGVDDHVDCLETDSGGREGAEKLLLCSVNIACFITTFATHARLAGDSVQAGAHNDRVQAEEDAILRVSRGAYFPERFGNDTERNAAVGEIGALTGDRQLEVSQFVAAADGVDSIGALRRMGNVSAG